MQSLKAPETLDPPGSQTLEPKTLAEPQTLAMPLPPDPRLDSNYAVGNFVWGNIKNHPWWPGRVCDPSEASDHVTKSPPKDQRSVLVAYYGDDTFAWCSHSQLKPFAENFHQMASACSSKSFTAALNLALGELSKCLEAEMSCNCLPDKHVGKNARIGSFTVEEFLTLLNVVAVDCLIANALEIAMLRSWVVAFEKGVTSAHNRKAIGDLVDKIDLVVLAVKVADGKEEGEDGRVSGSRVLTGPSYLVEQSQGGRKKRSMAVLIGQMDLESDEAIDSEEVKKGSRKDLKVANGNGSGGDGVKEKEGGLGRRERKKSKYLSPPYCFLSGGGLAKSLVSAKEETRIPKSTSVTSTISSSRIQKCSPKELTEESKSGSVIQMDRVEIGEVFSEFTVTAVNPLYLKGNRLGRTVRGFFAIYRSSVFSSGAGFECYQKKLADNGMPDGNTMNRNMGSKSEEGKKMEVRRGRKRKGQASNECETLIEKSEETKKTEVKRGGKRKDQLNGVAETPKDLGRLTSDHCDKIDKAAPNVKLTEDANRNASVTPKPEAVTGSVEGSSRRRRRRRKTDAKHNITLNMSSSTVNNLETTKAHQNMANEMGSAGVKISAELDADACNQTNENHLKDCGVTDVPINVQIKIANGSGERKFRQKMINKSTASLEDPAALLLRFSPGVNLPSKEELVSACSKYGPLVQSETELVTESSSGRVVFMRTSDAEKAYDDKVGTLGQLIASCRLRYLSGNLSSSPALTPMQVPKPPLPYIRKNLARMISTLNGSPLEKVAGASDVLKPETRDNLLGEMQGLLTKVTKMLSGPAAGTST